MNVIENRLKAIRLLMLAALMAAASSHAAEYDLQFAIHNLHFTQFDAGGFAAPGVTHAVHKDSRGRLWIGTDSGLFLFDGHEVRSFQPRDKEPQGLPHAFVKAVVEGQDGTIWIGTWGGGLAYFDEDTRTLRQANVTTHETGFDGRIWSMTIDDENRIWLGSFNSGLFRYDPATGELLNVFRMPEDADGRGNRIDAIYADPRGRIWFSAYRNGIRIIDADTFELQLQDATVTDPRISDIDRLADERILITHWNSVEVWDLQGNRLKAFDVTPSDSSESIMNAVPVSESAALIGTAGGNLWHVDVVREKVLPIPTGQHRGAMAPSIVWDMELGADGTLLIAGTTGVWLTAPFSRQFWTISGFENGRPLFFNETRAIHYDGRYLYLNSGTRIFRLEFDGSLQTLRRLEGELFTETLGNRPLWLERSRGKMWIGTDKALLVADEDNGKVRGVNDGIGVQTILDSRTGELFIDAKRRLLNITAENFHEMMALVESGFADESRLAANHLGLGSNNDVWAGTFSGLDRFRQKSGEPLPVFSRQAEKNDWNNPYVTFTHPVSNERLLIGTSEGVWDARLDPAGSITRMERVMGGMPFSTSAFDAFAQAQGGKLYLFGDPGVVEFHPDTGAGNAISVDEGFPDYTVYSAGYHQWGDLAVLSGQYGPLLFHPGDLEFATEPRELIITDITSFRENETINWPLHGPPLAFEYADRVIRFKFGLLDYFNPTNDRYAIRLVGFQNEWLDLGSLREFNFTNLDAGDYRLEIRVTEGLTGKLASTSIPFSVLPPWWRTWWAYTIYTLAIFGALFWYGYSLRKKLEREKEITARLREADRIKSHFLNELEEKVEDATQDLRHAVEALEIKNVELDAAQQRALDASRLKSEFLANMSHEIRTPMNGVLGFTRLLGKSKMDDEQRDYVETIEKSANSLLGIINDVLDVSKIEAGKLMIDSVGFDPRQCLADTLEALSPVAYEKNLELIDHVDIDIPEGLRGDPARIRQMITNLVGNSLKFTDTGHVRVHLCRHIDAEKRQWLRIEVADTGRGIGAEDRARLFQAFEQGHVNLTGRYTGTGLGLVITKKLCEAMGGQIDLDSVPGEGTRVKLDLPLVADRNPENRYGFGKPLSGRKVLLVDPYTPSRDALHARLLHWGADVTALAALAGKVEADLVVIGVERVRLGEADALKQLCVQLPEKLPRLCLAASADHEALRSLSEACNAPCLPKVGHFENQLRRMTRKLGVPWNADGDTAEPAVERRLAGVHALIADDNRINRYFLKKILELHGAEVTETDSGEGVLRLMKNRDRAFDIALLDVHMPDMDGLEVAQRIRSSGDTRLPLLAVSANVQPDTYEAAITAGINDYLLKPVEENKLVEAVLEWTGRETVTSE